jgi:hypothetical protein
MTFKKFFTQWIIVTIVFAVVAFLCTVYAPQHILWPHGLGVFYLGVLFLLLGSALLKK